MESIPSKEKELVVEVASATPDDAEGIQDVMYEAWRATYPNEEAGITPEDIDDQFKDRNVEERKERSRKILENIPDTERRLVAKINGRVVGVSRIIKEEERNKLQALYVHPDYQGKGIGTSLWKEAQLFFDPQKDTYLEVATYNDRAITFYKGLGFKDTGKRMTDERFRMKSGNAVPEMEMQRPASEQPSSWIEYHELTKHRPPRESLVEAVGLVMYRDVALDLGAGALADSKYLLDAGFKRVVAVDIEPTVADKVETLDDRIEVKISSFEDFDFKKDSYDFISAQYSLPFTSPNHFSELFERLKNSLKKGGVFTGQFFGENDEWKTDKSMSFHTREQIEDLLKGMQILKLSETQKDGKTAAGINKHWHVFTVTARKSDIK